MCLKMRYSTSIDITYCAKAAIYTKNLLTQVNRMKNAIMQMTYLLNDYMVNLFCCHITNYILRESDFLREI